MAERRADVAEAKRRVPVAALEREAAARRHHSLSDRLRRAPAPRIIAEVKKASPSAGLLQAFYDPAAVAAEYEACGAIAISVLTEPRHFLGSEADLRQVRQAVGLPILRKDFLCDPYQVCEAAAWGADVVLLIAAALDAAGIRDLHQAAVALGLDVIVEIHAADELDAALACEGAVIGVNSRNLKTLTTDLAIARGLAAAIPAGRLRIAESGIRRREEIVELQELGYDGFLIGESLLRGEQPGRALRRLRAG